MENPIRWQDILRQAIEASEWRDASFTWQGLEKHRRPLWLQYEAARQVMGKRYGREELEQLTLAIQLLNEILDVFNACGHDETHFALRW